MELSIAKTFKLVNSCIFFTFIFTLIHLSALSSNTDFSIIIKTENGDKRILNNNELIPLSNQIQIKIYSKQEGLIDIFYTSSETDRTSLFEKPIEVGIGDLVTIPSEDEFIPMELNNGNVLFEFGFSGDNEKSITQLNLIATDFHSKNSNISFSDNTILTKIDLEQSKGINKALSNFKSLSDIQKVVDDNTKNLKFNKLRGYEDLYSAVAKSTVYIGVYEDEEYFEGSGVIINSNDILTNLHVIRNADEVFVIKFGDMAEDPANDISYFAEVKRIAEDKDLAVIRVNTKLNNPITMNKDCNIRVGQDAHAVGHPKGNYWSYTKGYISQIKQNYQWNYEDQTKYNADVIQTQTPINPGNSGGPLVNNDAELIGINSFMEDGIGINYAVACNELVTFLKSPDNFSGWPDKKDKNIDKEASNENVPDDFNCWDHDKDGIDDTCSADTDKNGNIDIYLVDEDFDGDYDFFYIDENENEIYELKILISASWEEYDHDIYLFDDNEDNKWDRAGHDYDNDQTIDEFQDFS